MISHYLFTIQITFVLVLKGFLSLSCFIIALNFPVGQFTFLQYWYLFVIVMIELSAFVYIINVLLLRWDITVALSPFNCISCYFEWRHIFCCIVTNLRIIGKGEKNIRWGLDISQLIYWTNLVFMWYSLSKSVISLKDRMDDFLN